MKHSVMISIGGVLVLGFLYMGFATDLFRSKSAHDFISCASYGNPVAESYPRTCTDKYGNSFTEDLGVSNMIRVSSPSKDQEFTGVVDVKGEARGMWFFEASFPIVLESETGRQIAVSYGTAEKDWMVEDFVPFSATVTFSVATKTPGVIILRRDNPSGQPEFDREIRIPIMLLPNKKIPNQSEPLPDTSCRTSGCSGELCVEASASSQTISTCEYKEEYACLPKARCERQADRTCGWTKTPEYHMCMEDLAKKKADQ